MPRSLLLLAVLIFFHGFMVERIARAADSHAFFEKKIRPVLVEHCYECHSSSTEKQGGLLLDSRAGVEAGGDNGPVIVKGKAADSLLIQAMRYNNRELQMPPSGKLPDQVIADFETWIENGAPDPRDGELVSAAVTGMSIKEGKDFWSFQPIVKPEVPKIEGNAGFIRNPIDAFVLRKLQEKDLSPAPTASKRTLLRRVTHDLVGLPPTFVQLQEFLADDSPDALRQVVAELLESQDYGIHWGRHWLDVVRYADSNGLDENIGFGNAWRYRDYVIDSLNADKSFRDFLVEQVAGDLLPNATPETITATCFLQLGPKVMAEPDVEKLHLDVIDEQLDTLGKAFLGMTFGCVRCHDHKFDPIKHEDYYALAAIFKSTKTFGEKRNGAIKFWYEHSLADECELEELKSVDAALKEKTAAATTFKNQEIAKLRKEAREKAVDYLVACTQFAEGSSLEEVAKIAAGFELHPRILHHCRLHLEYHRDDSVFAAWHELKSQVEKLREHYSSLFENAEAAWAEALKADPKAK
ncbi:MAG: DUF1549 domain-containing protein, partial [Planctomycetota bacterium]